MATLSTGPIWPTVLTPAALAQLADELDHLLGPTVRNIAITADPNRHRLHVTLDPLGHTLRDVTWQTCVHLAELWPDAFAGAHVDLAVTDGRHTITTNFGGMVDVADGATRDRWHATTTLGSQ